MQAFNEAGIAFEPFHLKKEREEGYFDTDGNYIQYKLDEVKDAWLDSLAEGGRPCLMHTRHSALAHDVTFAGGSDRQDGIGGLQVLQVYTLDHMIVEAFIAACLHTTLSPR